MGRAAAVTVKCPFGDTGVVIFSSVGLRRGGVGVATPGQGRYRTVLASRMRD